MDKADKLDLKQSTRRPFKSSDLAFSREVNRQGQRNWAILYIFTIYNNYTILLALLRGMLTLLLRRSMAYIWKDSRLCRNDAFAVLYVNRTEFSSGGLRGRVGKVAVFQRS